MNDQLMLGLVVVVALPGQLEEGVGDDALAVGADHRSLLADRDIECLGRLPGDGIGLDLFDRLPVGEGGGGYEQSGEDEGRLHLGFRARLPA